jgi:hypothetical protein
MKKDLSDAILGFSDFQLFFLLHLYISLSNKSNIIRLRPNKLNFPLSLKEVAVQIGHVLSEIELSPEYVAFSRKPSTIFSYEDIKNRYIINDDFISEGTDYASCLTEKILSYKNEEWSMALFFNNEDMGISSDLKSLLELYRSTYTEQYALRDYEFIKNAESKLMVLTRNNEGVLDLNFNKKSKGSEGMLQLLLFHFLWYDGISDKIDILNQNSEYFPYEIRFKSNFHIPDYTPQLMNFEIKNWIVKINWTIVFDNLEWENASRIMQYFIEKLGEPMFLWEVLDYINPGSEPSSAKCAKLRIRLNRMRAEIIERTGIDFFASVWRASILLNSNVIIKSQ